MRRLAPALLGLLALGTTLGAEPQRRTLPDPGGEAWKPFVFGSIERHTRYVAVTDADAPWLRAESACAASARITPLDDVDLTATPILRWRWRVDEGLDVEDERTRSGDDFAARVYVMFRFEPERAGWWARMRHGLGRAAYDLEPPGTALSLVWSSREPEGASWRSPHGDESAMLVVANDARRERGRWHDPSVDLEAAYRRAFGQDPPPLLALGVMTDTDDTCGRARAGFADFSFSTRD